MQAKFQRVVILLSDFSHDVNGNPNALHTVYGYKTITANTDNCGASFTLHESKRRAQIGYSNERDCNAGQAFKNARLNIADFDLVEIKGDRSEGYMHLIYNLKGATPTVDDATKKYIESEMLQVCPLPVEKCGIIRLQMSSERGKTKHLNISPEQFRAIEKILTGE